MKPPSAYRGLLKPEPEGAADLEKLARETWTHLRQVANLQVLPVEATTQALPVILVALQRAEREGYNMGLRASAAQLAALKETQSAELTDTQAQLAAAKELLRRWVALRSREVTTPITRDTLAFLKDNGGQEQCNCPPKTCYAEDLPQGMTCKQKSSEQTFGQPTPYPNG